MLSIILISTFLSVVMGRPWPAFEHPIAALHPRLAEEFYGNRAVWDIIRSCFATLFACTWVAVHPNIPSAKDSELRICGRRLAIMGYLLFVPEVVIMWAARQHFAARDLANRYQRGSRRLSQTGRMLTRCRQTEDG